MDVVVVSSSLNSTVRVRREGELVADVVVADVVQTRLPLVESSFI